MDVLIVDDDAATRQVLAAAISDEALKVGTAADGAEALACIIRERPRLVLLDLLMPILTGWDVLNQLATLDPTLPVVVMTAARLSSAAMVRVQQQAAALLPKPFALDDLLQCVHNHIERSPPRVASPIAVTSVRAPRAEAGHGPGNRSGCGVTLGDGSDGTGTTGTDGLPFATPPQLQAVADRG